jgi:hypothetical protein
MIKRMSDTILPLFNDVGLIIKEVMGQTEAQIIRLDRKGHVRLLQHTAIFIERQFGKKVPGKTAYERDNGDRLDNWDVEICTFVELYKKLVSRITIYDAFGMSTFVYLK